MKTAYGVERSMYYFDMMGELQDVHETLGLFSNPFEADEIVEYLIDMDLDNAEATKVKATIVQDECYYSGTKEPGMIRIDNVDGYDCTIEYNVSQQIIY